MERKSGIEILSILEQRVSTLMSFKFLNEMRRGGLIAERESAALNVRRKWSFMGSSSEVQLEGVRPEQQSKSSVCPLVCVGKSMY